MDLLLFTSKKELNPICVKEALSWRMPVLMRHLETCVEYYVNNSLVRFIDDDISKTVDMIEGTPSSMKHRLLRVYELAGADVRQRAV